MPIFDFHCSCGRVTEAIRPASTETVPCACGEPARRTGVNVGIGIVGPTTDTRGMYRRFSEATAELGHAAARHEQQTGRPAPVPNLWQAAKRAAQARVAAGEAVPARQIPGRMV